jgi:hypothetical protein
VGYLTVLDCTPYPSKKEPGKVYQYGLKLFPAKMGTLSILQRKREELVSLVNKRCEIFRDATGKSPNVGNEFTFKDEVTTDKLDAMFMVANYKGKKLADLFEAAERDEVAMKKLSFVFQLARDANGKLIRRIPPFNYEKLLSIRTPEETSRLLGGNVTGNYEESKRMSLGGGGGGGGDGGGTAEGAPF